MQAEKDVLRYLLGLFAVAEEMVGDTEHHRTVFPHQLAKIPPGLYCPLDACHFASVTYVTLLLTFARRKLLFTMFTEIIRL